MEEQLVTLLTNTQSAEQGPREQAENELKLARTNPAFPVALANIAAHTSVDTSVRQGALSTLRLFIEKNWSGEDRDGEPQIEIPESTRQQLRQVLLELSLSNEDNRKVKISSR
jgi:importin-9